MFKPPSPMLLRLCSKSCMLGFSITWTENFQMLKLVIEKAEEPEIKLPTFAGSYRKQGNSRKASTSVSLTTLKPLTVWIIRNYGKLLKRWEYQTILPVSWETCMWVKKQQLEPCMEQLTGSGLRKAYDRAVCCHPVNLTYMLSTLREMLVWMSFKWESRQAGKTTRTWHVDDTWNHKTTASWQESYDKPRQCVE